MDALLEVEKQEGDYEYSETGLSSTRAMKDMISAINKDEDQERDPEQEEVYDYFFDAHADENAHDNKGYHIIDPEDLNDEEEDQVEPTAGVDDDEGLPK